MSFDLNDPREFTEHVVEKIRELKPEYAVEILGPMEVLVNGRRVNLENLKRMAGHEPNRKEEIVAHYLEQLFSDDCARLLSVMTIDFAKAHIMPRIQPASIFEHLSPEQVAHVPFVNNTVKVFVTDFPSITVSIANEQLVRWKLSVEELEDIAQKNLEKSAPELEVQVVHSKDGGHAAILKQGDGYDAARICLSDIWSKFHGELGNTFYAAIPSRDVALAFTTGPQPFTERLRKRVEFDYKRLPYPITPDLFLVTQDGVCGTIGTGVKDVDAGDITFG